MWRVLELLTSPPHTLCCGAGLPAPSSLASVLGPVLFQFSQPHPEASVQNSTFRVMLCAAETLS